jgi:hypothetical protein
MLQEALHTLRLLLDLLRGAQPCQLLGDNRMCAVCPCGAELGLKHGAKVGLALGMQRRRRLPKHLPDHKRLCYGVRARLDANKAQAGISVQSLLLS